MRFHSTLPVLTPSQIARFWSHVERVGIADGCWLWTGTPSQRTPHFEIAGRQYGIARISYQIAHGTIPPGLFVCHHCDIPRCVNPAHLFVGTTQDNTADRHRKGRDAKGDRNGSRLHPERLARGEMNPSRRYPERLARGERHGWHTKPDRVPRGDRNVARRRPETRRGERNGRAKLTWEQVADMRARYAAGKTRASLAREFGVSWTVVDDIVQGRRWTQR